MTTINPNTVTFVPIRNTRSAPVFGGGTVRHRIPHVPKDDRNPGQVQRDSDLEAELVNAGLSPKYDPRLLPSVMGPCQISWACVAWYPSGAKRADGTFRPVLIAWNSVALWRDGQVIRHSEKAVRLEDFL